MPPRFVHEPREAVRRDAYGRLATVYDAVFDLPLRQGRRQAVARMNAVPGTAVLEIGVGTGVTLPLYPAGCRVTGIDLNSEMLRRAVTRRASRGRATTSLCRMDGAHLAFPDDTFDVVYAPYLISVVPDPLAVAREMWRVCRPGGRLIILNHFRSAGRWLPAIEDAIAPLCDHIGLRTDLDRAGFLRAADLKPETIERVNALGLWSLITCTKRPRTAH